MERATLIARADQLDLVEDDARRVYFGSEFCQNLIPTETEVMSVLQAARDSGRAFTLVTPLVTDVGLDRLDPVLAALASEETGCEVVANDWGVLSTLRDQRLEPLMGRVLNRLRKGPRIMRVIDRLPDETLRQYRENNLTVPVFRRFLHERGVRRVEVDNPLQGLELDLSKGPDPLEGSLYTPFMAVTTTRLCPTANSDSDKPVRIGVWPCGRQCRTTSFTLTHPVMPGPLLLQGNAVFYENHDVPDEERLAEMGITRLVVQPRPPV